MRDCDMTPFYKSFENLSKPPGGYSRIEVCTIRRYKPPGLAPALFIKALEPHQCDPDYCLEPGTPAGPVEVGVFASISNEAPRLLFVCDTPECAIEALAMMGNIPPLVPDSNSRPKMGPHITIGLRKDECTHRVIAAFNNPGNISDERFSLAVEIVKTLLSPSAQVFERQDLPDELSDISPNSH